MVKKGNLYENTGAQCIRLFKNRIIIEAFDKEKEILKRHVINNLYNPTRNVTPAQFLNQCLLNNLFLQNLAKELTVIKEGKDYYKSTYKILHEYLVKEEKYEIVKTFNNNSIIVYEQKKNYYTGDIKEELVEEKPIVVSSN
jgi:hypothetical protein